MMRRAVHVLMLLAASVAPLQGQGANRAPRTPRFYLASQASSPATLIEAEELPLLRNRIAVALEGVRVQDALTVIAKQAGFVLWYNDDVLPATTRVHLRATSISVAAALTDVLTGVQVDVVFARDGSASLVPRRSAVGSAPLRPETIRGRVTTDSGMPVPGATVSATMAPDRSFQQATTDASGRFAITFRDGTGDYLIHVSAIGFRAFRKRLTRTPTDTALTINVTLSPSVPQLARVQVVEQRPTPRRGIDQSESVGAAEQWREGNAALAPDQEGDLTALANAYLGATAGENGVGVLGLGGDQSRVTLNGMAFNGATLPRDAQTITTIRTSAYDPAVGGFSGAQVAVTLLPGGTYYIRNAHLSLDAPPLQATTSIGDRLGTRFTSMRGSIGGLGEWKPDRWYYNSAVSVSRTTSDAASLLSVGDAALRAQGVAPDSAAQLQRVLVARGIPLTVAGVPRTNLAQSVSFIARIDHAPGTYMRPARSTWNLTLFGTLNDAELPGAFATSLPLLGGRRDQRSAGAQYQLSRFYGGVLNELRSSVSVNRSVTSPYVRLPAGNVLVGSGGGSGESAFSSLTFGGSGQVDTRQSDWTWETLNETQWYAKGKPHRIKLSLETRLDGYALGGMENLLGTFSYPSLAALAAGQPASFTRALSSPGHRGGQLSGFAAVGDYWRATRKLELLYGARLEGNRFLTELEENPVVRSAFGATTAARPNRLHVSPRAGFTWTPKRNSPSFSSISALSIKALWPAMELRGGIGEFRELPSSRLLNEASAANGLASSMARLTCIGEATPSPRWDEYLANPSTVPTACASGAPAVFSDATPSVRLVDPSFDARRSWRANLAWRQVIGNVGVLVDGTYSLNLDQPGSVDLNFARAAQFTLASEGGRPVYVSPPSIVAQTGAVSSVEARSRPEFGSVMSRRSDLRSTSRQLTVTAKSNLSKVQYTLGYALLGVSEQSRGFDATTFGDPWQLERTPGAGDVRHQVQATLSAPLPHRMSVSLFGRISSGRPYTPRIAGDVNGDGLANDRAFIFDPATTPDPALASALRSLLNDAPSQARVCLLTQLGSPAARNSCRGPWTAAMNASVVLYQQGSPTRRRVDARLFLSNPLGGLDQLLHGSKLQGWGDTGLPDPTLLRVRGFDQASRSFRYDVNPRFGSTRSAQRVGGTPFRVTLDVHFDLGIPFVKQQALQLLKPGRRGAPGARLSTDSTAGVLKRTVPDVYRAIIQESDSLLISREQLAQLEQARIPYRARMDSLWNAAAAKITSMGEDYDANVAMHIIDDATKQGWVIGREELPVLARILTPLQLQLAPLVPTLRDVGKREMMRVMF